MSEFKYSRLEVFDNLELSSPEDEVAYFPFHFHEYFCISLIIKGTEQLFGTDQCYFVPAVVDSFLKANQFFYDGAIDEIKKDIPPRLAVLQNTW